MSAESGRLGAVMHRVMVVGERPEEGNALAFDLTSRGLEAVASSGDSTAALQSLLTFGPDAIILNLNSGGTNQELFRTLHKTSRLPIVVLTDDYAESDLVWHLEAGAAAYLAKPLSPEALCAHLTAVIRRV